VRPDPVDEGKVVGVRDLVQTEHGESLGEA